MAHSVSPIAAERSAPAVALLSVDDVAALLAVSTRTIRRMADGGQMPRPVKLGSLVRWRRSDVDEWLAAGCPSCRPTRGTVR